MDNSLSADAQQVLAIVSNGHISRQKLIEKLSWSWERYKSAEAELTHRELVSVKQKSGVSLIAKRDLADALKFSSDAAKLLARELPSNGDVMSTISLNRQLKIAPTDFHAAVSELVDSAVILKPEGSRSVRLAPEYTNVEQVKSLAGSSPSIVNTLEKDLYEGFGQKVLEWAISQEFSQEELVLEKTAYKGRKDTGGKWTRPDYTLVTLVKYPLLPGHYLEVITFEVKSDKNWDVEAVFEAASHSRGSTQSYLAIYKFSQEPQNAKARRILEECRRFGVGLFSFDGDASNPIELLLEAERTPLNPDPANEFLEVILNPQNQQELASRQTANISFSY